MRPLACHPRSLSSSFAGGSRRSWQLSAAFYFVASALYSRVSRHRSTLIVRLSRPSQFVCTQCAPGSWYVSLS